MSALHQHRASRDELGTKSSTDSGEGMEGKRIAVAVPRNQGVVFVCVSLLIVLAFLETKNYRIIYHWEAIQPIQRLPLSYTAP